jgi:hypothetical protein
MFCGVDRGFQQRMSAKGVWHYRVFPFAILKGEIVLLEFVYPSCNPSILAFHRIHVLQRVVIGDDQGFLPIDKPGVRPDGVLSGQEFLFVRRVIELCSLQLAAVKGDRAPVSGFVLLCYLVAEGVV